MLLDDFALGLLFFVGIVLFYGLIAIHDIPYKISKHRDHPHQDAIYVAGWVSIFTLHVIWPFLWIWATLYREDRGWGSSEGKGGAANMVLEKRIANLTERLEAIEGEGAVVSSVKTRPNTASFSTIRQTPAAEISSKEDDVKGPGKGNTKDSKDEHSMQEGVVPGSLRIRRTAGNSPPSRPMTAEDFLPKEEDAKEESKEADEGVVSGSLRTRPNTANFSSTRPMKPEDFLPQEDDTKEEGDK